MVLLEAGPLTGWGIAHLYLLSTGITGTQHHTWLFPGVLGDHTQVLMLGVARTLLTAVSPVPHAQYWLKMEDSLMSSR